MISPAEFEAEIVRLKGENEKSLRAGMDWVTRTMQFLRVGLDKYDCERFEKGGFGVRLVNTYLVIEFGEDMVSINVKAGDIDRSFGMAEESELLRLIISFVSIGLAYRELGIGNWREIT